MMKACYLVQILKHNLPGVFEEQELIGLQYELECLSYDHQVDYMEFLDIFFEDAASKDGPQ